MLQFGPSDVSVLQGFESQGAYNTLGEPIGGRHVRLNHASSEHDHKTDRPQNFLKRVLCGLITPVCVGQGTGKDDDGTGQDFVSQTVTGRCEHFVFLVCRHRASSQCTQPVMRAVDAVVQVSAGLALGSLFALPRWSQ